MKNGVFPTAIHGCLGIRVLGTLAAVAAGMSHASAQLSLWIDPTTTTLQANTSGQIVRVLFQNTGLAFPVVGGSLYCQIDDGDSSVVQAPVITAISITDITGNPFTSSNLNVTTTSVDGEFWDVTFDTLPPSPVTPINLTASSLYTFAEVTIDTTGFSAPGQWAFKIVSTISGNSSFVVEDPDPNVAFAFYYPSATNGMIQIGAVPIPEATLPAGGAGVLGFALLSSVWRRRISALGTGPG